MARPTTQLVALALALVLTLVASAATTSHADGWKPKAALGFEVPAHAPTPSPVPSVKIKSPASLDMLKTHEQTVKDKQMHGASTTFVCALDKPDLVVQLDVAGWPMTPTGNGVTIVVDNRWSTVVHDASRPIHLSSFIPALSEQSLDGTCGWHFVAAFATLPSGESVKAAPAVAVTYFHLGADGGDDMKQIMTQSLVIVNLPMLGQYADNLTGDAHPYSAGYVVRNHRACVDFLLWDNDQGFRPESAFTPGLTGLNLGGDPGQGGVTLGEIPSKSYGPGCLTNVPHMIYDVAVNPPGRVVVPQQFQTRYVLYGE